jgi:hypothetical protein
MLGVVLLFLLVFAPMGGPQTTIAAEVPSFDPDQPFRESLSTQLLRSMLNRAMDALEDHLQIDGTLAPANPQGDQQGHLELKLYPKGKSKSDEHVKAEGWFSFSPESGLHDFHLRFKQPRERSAPRSDSPADRL